MPVVFLTHILQPVFQSASCPALLYELHPELLPTSNQSACCLLPGFHYTCELSALTIYAVTLAVRIETLVPTVFHYIHTYFYVRVFLHWVDPQVL
jgi:hypothetical protein